MKDMFGAEMGMFPVAADEINQRKWETPECRKSRDSWRIAFDGVFCPHGVIIDPINGVYGQRLAWAGRDHDDEFKQAQWLKSRGKNEPMRFRFPNEKFFRRGLELSGQESNRLEEDGFRKAIQQTGILVVEGMNDVIALDAMKQPAVAIMSNRITEEQVKKVVTWAQSLAKGKVTLMLDGDKNGCDGAKESLWRLAQQTPVQTVVLKTRDNQNTFPQRIGKTSNKGAFVSGHTSFNTPTKLHTTTYLWGTPMDTSSALPYRVDIITIRFGETPMNVACRFRSRSCTARSSHVD